MADYIDLRRLMNDSELYNKVEVATIIAANNLISGSPSVAQTQWAASAFASPKTEAKKALMAVIAINKSATIAQIQSATDAAIQTNVDSVVPTLVAAKAGV